MVILLNELSLRSTEDSAKKISNLVLKRHSNLIAMSDSPRRALLALGVSRLLNLEQKKRQKDRARKVSAYLKMTKAIHSDMFKNQLRIDSSSLFKLLGLVRPFIESLKVDLEEVSVEERLLVTLKYLATGCSMEQLSYGPVKPRLLMSIIPETCNAIYKCLRECVKLPKTEKAWEEIALEFEKQWQFSNCAGALVAKHISVQKPLDEPEKFVNHKRCHSIVVVGLVNANHEFTYINTGSNGGYEHVYASTNFFEMMTEDRLQLPKGCPLNGTEESMPYIFVGETDFLIENIMRPYPKDQLTPEKKVFNYRFFRAKQVADNAFGMLYERFGLFHKELSVKEEDFNSVVMACCVLHNYLIRNSKDYLSEGSMDVEDVNSFNFKTASWRLKQEGGMLWGDTHPLLSLKQGPETTPDSRGEIVRDMFTKYFNNEGKVPFQDQMVNVVPEI